MLYHDYLKTIDSCPFCGCKDRTFIDNKNVRVLGIPGQKPLLLYSFPEQNVLVITTSTAAMKEIFNRLVSYQFSN